MNETFTHRVIITLLVLLVILTGVSMYVVNSQLKSISQSLQTSTVSMLNQACVSSGGEWQSGACVCERDYFLENGMCMGQDGMTAKELNEVKIGQERLMNPVGSTDASSIVYGDFALQLPLNMDFQKTAEGRWNIISDASKKIGELTCPPPETGYEAWDFTETSKSYTRGGKTLYARKFMGRPLPDAGDIGGIALIYAGETNTETYNPNSCQILIDLATPATAEQRDWVDTLYGLIY